MISAMAESLPEETETMGQSLAAGMLSTAEEGDGGPTTDVVHRDRDSPQNGDELRRRVEAVTAVANAVDRVDAGR